MLFSSIDFAIFLPLVFCLYWMAFNRSLRIQNSFLLIASYFFYGWWDWRFLSLISFSTLVDYAIGLLIFKQCSPQIKKILLLTSLCVNLGLLGFFKYFNFFIENFISVFSFCNLEFNPKTLNIVLPVGISFYTFQTLSYTIDIYRNKIEPTKDFITFAAFVAFFPQLVAGPIERATNLLPQFQKNRSFDYAKAVDGLRQMLWGFFKKMVIADNCGQYVDIIFQNHTHLSSSTLLLGAILFSFQLYCDFSGYSDIAIGASRLFGFNLMRNFAFPYFSRNNPEYWSRWHISLSTWFRDYVYIPLGGNKGKPGIKMRNLAITFLAIGLWHGANWTFIAWGMINAMFFLPYVLGMKKRKDFGMIGGENIFPSFKEFCQMVATFFSRLIPGIFFRAGSISDAFGYILGLFSFSIFSMPSISPGKAQLGLKALILLVICFTTIEWLQRDKQHALQLDSIGWAKAVRWAAYSFVVFSIGMYMHTGETPFLYFQF
jgi:alginate O-acetyltransferase complex protein AlgI